MSTYEGVKVIGSMKSAVAFPKGSAHKLVGISTAANTRGKLVLTDRDAADVGGRTPVGVLALDQTKADEAVTVVDLDGGGIGKVRAAGAIAVGQVLVPTAANANVGSVDGVDGPGAIPEDTVAVGIALEAAAAAGEIISFKIARVAAPHVA